jgi:hypothetical protein
VTGFFSEQGTIGKRDTVVYKLARRDSIVKSGWMVGLLTTTITILKGFLDEYIRKQLI